MLLFKLKKQTSKNVADTTFNGDFEYVILGDGSTSLRLFPALSEFFLYSANLLNTLINVDLFTDQSDLIYFTPSF